MNMTQAIERAKKEIVQIPETKLVIDFIEGTKRGVIGGGRSNTADSAEG